MHTSSGPLCSLNSEFQQDSLNYNYAIKTFYLLYYTIVVDVLQWPKSSRNRHIERFRDRWAGVLK